jgi:hypothetical protein
MREPWGSIRRRSSSCVCRLAQRTERREDVHLQALECRSKSKAKPAGEIQRDGVHRATDTGEDAAIAPSIKNRPVRATGGQTPGIAALAKIASRTLPLERITSAPVTSPAQSTCSRMFALQKFVEQLPLEHGTRAHRAGDMVAQSHEPSSEGHERPRISRVVVRVQRQAIFSIIASEVQLARKAPLRKVREVVGLISGSRLPAKVPRRLGAHGNPDSNKRIG